MLDVLLTSVIQVE